MLEGVTRRTVLELTQAQGLGVEVRALTADETRGGDEVLSLALLGG